MMSKKNLLIFAVVASAGMLFSVTSDVESGGQGRHRLDGAWLVSNPDVGIRGLETVTSIDPSGLRFSVRLTTLSGDPTVGGLCPAADYLSAGVGEAVMTGPSTADATIMAYAMRVEFPRDQIECIWVLSGTTQFTEDTQDALVNFAIYPTWLPPEVYPNPDANDDLIPDEGVSPYVCLPIPFQAKRVPMMPPCGP